MLDQKLGQLKTSDNLFGYSARLAMKNSSDKTFAKDIYIDI